jgi:poly(A) polymerase
MLRAIRFACVLGFSIVPETWSAIQKLASLILQVSWERIRDELTLILTSAAASEGLELLRASGLLRYILPEVAAMCGVPQSIRHASEADVFTHTRHALALIRKPTATLAFGTLLHDVGKPESIASESKDLSRHAEIGAKTAEVICRRLRMSNEETRRVASLVCSHSEFARARDMSLSTLKKLLRKPEAADGLELHRADRMSANKDLDSYFYCLQKLKEYRSQPTEAPVLKGEDLIAMGYPQGPALGEILSTIEDLQLQGTIRTREEAVAFVKARFPPSETKRQSKDQE